MFKSLIDQFKRIVCNEHGTMAWIAIGTVVIAGGFEAYSAYSQGAASKRMRDYQAQQEQVDAQQAYAVGQAQSQQVAQQGELNSQTLAFKNAQEVGAMRTAEAANGISANSVTAENLAVNHFNKGNRDESMLSYNAQNKIWSIKTAAADQVFTDQQQSSLDVLQGKNEMAAGEMDMVGTLLSTASSVAGTAYKGSTTGKTLGSAPQPESIMG
jgi:hypothetical protein